MFRITITLIVSCLLFACGEQTSTRQVVDFNDDWYFQLENYSDPSEISFTASAWRKLNVPHDWSIEGEFSPDHPAGVGGGALPGGVGWYRKTFQINPEQLAHKIFIEFDGIYQNSTVWINGEKLGTRPNGYISFAYDLTAILKVGENTLDVRVDNSIQPNSRWYSGSGIYRNVRLVTKPKIYIPQWGQYVTTEDNQKVVVNTAINNAMDIPQEVAVDIAILDQEGQTVAQKELMVDVPAGTTSEVQHALNIKDPSLWSLDSPILYSVKTELVSASGVDEHTTTFGFRTFNFDAEKGFSLNGTPTKLKGVCLHHDLGALGAAFNSSAMKRELQIMKNMGVNAIRTAHNPPAPEVLDLCDQMGLLVMDEMFDMWSIAKTEHDYSHYWAEWHEQDLKDFIKRDRNHPSIVVWSIGNEIMEQYDHEDSLGGVIAQELAAIVRALDDRPIITANNDTSPENPLIKLGGLDIVGYNYHHDEYTKVPERFPGQPFIATETNSELSTRGHYDLPSDSQRVWPHRWDEEFKDGNPNNTVSAYDQVRPPWGSTHEDTWRIVKNNDFISGMFIWTGFDYLGEPTPYTWPSRSSYFGVVDLAGFPKDTYFMYQSEWSDDTVLHVLPHWNESSDWGNGWTKGQVVDVWAYYNQADEVELFVNGLSKGVKSKDKGQFHVMWRIPFEPGELKIVSRKNKKTVKVKVIRSSGKPAQILLTADRTKLAADGYDLAFITAEVQDAEGNLVPNASNRITFSLVGKGSLLATDNGDPVNHESFQSNIREAFHGKLMAIINGGKEPGLIQLKAESKGLKSAMLEINAELVKEVQR